MGQIRSALSNSVLPLPQLWRMKLAICHIFEEHLWVHLSADKCKSWAIDLIRNMSFLKYLETNSFATFELHIHHKWRVANGLDNTELEIHLDEINLTILFVILKQAGSSL